MVCRKKYELVNHLGNVLVVVSDRKLPHESTTTPGTIDYFLPDVVSSTDYGAFGDPLAGRTFNQGNYRYQFNGKEADPEISGNGNSYDYGFRIYNPRLGRFLSVDPLTKSYPWYTPYQFAGNKPIAAIDLDGLEENVVIRWYDNSNKYAGSTTFRINNEKDRLQATGTLVVNLNQNQQQTVNHELTNDGFGNTTKAQLFNVNDVGNPTSLKGGAILSESKNQLERNQVNEINNGDHSKTILLKFEPKVIEFVTPDNTDPVNPELVDKFKNVIENNPEFGIDVTGYASEEPGVSPAHNQKVSDDRAAKVKSDLTSGGVDPKKVDAKGAGTSNPKTSNETEAGRQQNRRAEIKTTIPKDKKYD